MKTYLIFLIMPSMSAYMSQYEFSIIYFKQRCKFASTELLVPPFSLQNIQKTWDFFK